MEMLSNEILFHLIFYKIDYNVKLDRSNSILSWGEMTPSVCLNAVSESMVIKASSKSTFTHEFIFEVV